MVKVDLPEEGKTLNGVPERPLGVTSLLVKEGAKLLLSWLAMVEAAVAIMVNQLRLFKKMILEPFLSVQLWARSYGYSRGRHI